MKIAACDDDAQVLAQVSAVLKAESSEYGGISVTAFQSSMALSSALEDSARFDLYLLDILMPGRNGMELAADIRKHDESAMLVFLTSSPEFAVDSYEVEAMGYLLKPVVPEKLSAILQKARQRLGNRKRDELLLSCGGTLRSVPLGTVMCVESFHNKLLYHLSGGETLETYGTIAEALERLSTDPRFIQPHRSYLVNMEYIREFGSKDIVLAGDLPAVPVSRASAPTLKAQYIEYMVHMAGGAQLDS